MFDPFGDFETAGYLRNTSAEKDLSIIKAVDYLATCDSIGYEDFLNVHRLLFSGLYPWAGQGRAAVMPEKAARDPRMRSNDGRQLPLAFSQPDEGRAILPEFHHHSVVAR